MAGMITNGYNLKPERIERLNRAGLDHLQISIDNVMPDDVSKKSLKVLEPAPHAGSRNTPTSTSTSTPSSAAASPTLTDAYTVSDRALALGFSSTIGIIHDGSGQLKPLGDAERSVWDKRPQAHPPLLLALQPLSGSHRQRQAQRLALPRRLALPVHLRDRPRASTAPSSAATPASRSPTTASRRQARVPHEKGCAPNCTISCVHQVSYIDHWRGVQTPHAPRPSAPTGSHGDLVQIN